MTDAPIRMTPYGLGKFETAADALIYRITLDGCDEELGDVETNGTWYGLLSAPIRLSPPFADVTPQTLSDLFGQDGPNAADVDYLSSLVFIVSEDRYGFVSVEAFDDPADARRMMDGLAAEIEAEERVAEISN